MNQSDFETIYPRISAKERSFERKERLKNSIRCTPKLGKMLVGRLLSFLPILSWLPRYKLGENLHKDVITGLIVGIMNVPQGMAYASLAEVPPVYGLYTAFFSGLFYMFFGTSRHISVGVFAVGSLMVGTVRLRLAPDHSALTNANGSLVNGTDLAHFGEEITPAMVISALTFGVGIVQIVLGLLHLSFVTTYMSDQLVSGYTTGSAFHVLTAQLDKLFGVKIGHYEGAFVLYYMIRDVILLIPSAPIMSVLLSIVGIAYLYVGREVVNPFVRRFSPIPVPHELILVVGATTFSYFMGAKEKYHVNVVNNIPRGFPAPTVPRLNLISQMMVDCVVIAIICYMFIISMAKLFAKKHKYQVDENQELFAIGFTSILGSFFPVYPAGASLSRSSVCEMSGVKTQLYGAVSSGLLLIVIVWFGPLLEPLPMCILACIITVSLKGLFLQFKELPRLWRTSKYDFAIWIVACFSTIITDPTYGLGISLGVVLLTVLFREQWPKVYHLAADKTGEVFKPKETYPGLSLLDNNINIFKFNCPLHFANSSRFLEETSKLMLSPGSTTSTDFKELPNRNHRQKLGHIKRWNWSTMINFWKFILTFRKSSYTPQSEPTVEVDTEKPELSCSTPTTSTIEEGKVLGELQRYFIVDCSSIAYVDTMGVEALQEVYSDGMKCGVRVFFASFTEQVLDTLESSGAHSKISKEHIFPTVQQAITFIGNANSRICIQPSSPIKIKVETKSLSRSRSNSL